MNGLAILCCLLVLPLTGCASSSPTIQLRGNPTTGYGWQVQRITPQGILRIPDPLYIPDPHAEQLVGSGGIFSFTPECLMDGKAEVLFVYLRPWENQIVDQRVVRLRCRSGKVLNERRSEGKR